MDSIENVLNEATKLVGKNHVVQDQATLTFYSTDIFSAANELAVAIIRPGNADELIHVSQICIKNEVPLIVRGGGASYTGGYLPVVKNTIMIDTQRLKNAYRYRLSSCREALSTRVKILSIASF